MASFTITVQDASVRQALHKLAERAGNLQPVPAGIGERILGRTKQRFGTSTGPDGVRWKATKKGNKPLIDKGTLSDQIVSLADAHSVTVGTNSTTAAYAAIHQFGGKAGRGHKVAITARPFLPVRQDGSLYPKEQAELLDAINNYRPKPGDRFRHGANSPACRFA